MSTSVGESASSNEGFFGSIWDYVKHHWIMIIGIIIAVLVIFSLIGVFSSIANSPFSKVINDLFGLADGIASIIDGQLTSCFSSIGDFFNPTKGCWLGVGGLATGAIYFGIKGASLAFQKKSDLLDQATFETGKSRADLVKDLKASSESMINDTAARTAELKTALGRDPKPVELNVYRTKLVTNKVTKTTNDAVRGSGLSNGEKAARIKSNIDTNSAFSRAQAESLEVSKDIADKIDEKANEVEPRGEA